MWFKSILQANRRSCEEECSYNKTCDVFLSGMCLVFVSYMDSFQIGDYVVDLEGYLGFYFVKSFTLRKNCLHRTHLFIKTFNYLDWHYMAM